MPFFKKFKRSSSTFILPYINNSKSMVNKININCTNNDSVSNQNTLISNQNAILANLIIQKNNNISIESSFDNSQIISQSPHSKLESELTLIVKSELNKEEVAALLLVLFYKGKLTQSSLSLVISFTNMIVPDLNLPKTFDQCLRIILKKNDDEINYKTYLNCNSCLQIFNDNQINCTVCNKKY